MLSSNVGYIGVFGAVWICTCLSMRLLGGGPEIKAVPLIP